jgi:hypothetical protein
MRPRWFAFGFLALCLIVAGRVSATTPGLLAPTPRPSGNLAHYIPISVHNLAGLAPLEQTATANAATATAIAQPTATGTPEGPATVGLSGTAFVRPRWVEYAPADPQPVLYVIVVDATDAMSYDFAGHGTIGDVDYQCELPINPGDPLPLTETCTGGAGSPWHNISERRAYVVKQALMQLVDQLHPTDAMRLIAYSSDLSGMAQPSAGWSSDKLALKNEILALGAYQQDSYRSTGYASGAIALKTARDLLATAPQTTPSGQAYKRVLILLSAGTPNIFVDGALNTARDICGNLSVWQAINTPEPCQLGSTAAGKLRPITAMVDQANMIKASQSSISIYVIDLARGGPTTGFSQIASSPNMYYGASQASLIDPVLDVIWDQVSAQICTQYSSNQWLDRIDTAHTPDSPPAPGNGVFGYVYIYDAESLSPRFVLPIKHDSTTGALGFGILPPDADNPSRGISSGVYTMKAFVDYKGNDAITRQYDTFFDSGLLVDHVRFQITVAQALGPVAQLSPIFMDLQPTANLCQA